MKKFTAVPGKGVVASKTISRRYIKASVDEAYAKKVANRFERYLKYQDDEVAQAGVDVQDGMFYVTIEFQDGYMVDGWDQPISDFSGDLKTDVAKLVNTYENIADNREE